MKICIPSRGRYDVGTTWNLFPSATVYVLEEELELYRSRLPKTVRFVTHDFRTSPTVRNFILRDNESNWILMLDDDIKHVGRFLPKDRSGETFKRVVSTSEIWLKELTAWVMRMGSRGFHLLGVAPNSNPLNYRGKPWKLNAFINGPCMAILCGERAQFDELMLAKCDYDFTCQHIKLGLGVLRIEFLWQENDYNSGKLKGGTRAYRTQEHEKQAYERLMKKWPGWFRPNTRRNNPWELILRAPTAQEK